ncbi:hypothetical protein CFAM422_011863 [Trichoderma lentiforme]|uniref:Uncharacterized protein n=1 Tax=Trichoderma lentiforme TaxID=1567552 RepID=A0A9P5C6X7_9HYPO|nr:hypothetical protein CFAM422_011863 [Trichoderma lentiforme]
MERRGLCSVDPRHAVARLLQAMKRADAKKDEKGADCRDGEKHGRLPDVKPYDLFREGNNGSRSRPEQRAEQREPARQFVQDPRGEAFASVASNRPRCAARLKHLRLKRKWTIANLDVILYPSVLVGAVKTVLSQSVQQQHVCWLAPQQYE